MLKKIDPAISTILVAAAFAIAVGFGIQFAGRPRLPQRA